MKKIFAVMLALAMVLTMTACGKKADKKPEAKDKIGSAQTGMELYVTTAEDGSKTVVDKSGKTAEGYTLDKSGNIVDKAGQIIVAADKVQQLPAKAADKTEPDTKTDTKTDTKPAEDSKSDTGSSGSSDSGSSSASGSGSSGSSSDSSSSGSSGSSSGGSSSDSGSSTPAAPDPTPVHQHSWQPVYRTEIVDDYEMREVIYCVTCGQKLTGDQVIDHSYYHLERGESDQQRETYEQVKVGSHEEQILDHYICSCGETKAP